MVSFTELGKTIWGGHLGEGEDVDFDFVLNLPCQWRQSSCIQGSAAQGGARNPNLRIISIYIIYADIAYI